MRCDADGARPDSSKVPRTLLKSITVSLPATPPFPARQLPHMEYRSVQRACRAALVLRRRAGRCRFAEGRGRGRLAGMRATPERVPGIPSADGDHPPRRIARSGRSGPSPRRQRRRDRLPATAEPASEGPPVRIEPSLCIVESIWLEVGSRSGADRDPPKCLLGRNFGLGCLSAGRVAEGSFCLRLTTSGQGLRAVPAPCPQGWVNPCAGCAGATSPAAEHTLDEVARSAGGGRRQLVEQVELVAQGPDGVRVHGEIGRDPSQVRGRADGAGQRTVQIEPHRWRRERPCTRNGNPACSVGVRAGVAVDLPRVGSLGAHPRYRCRRVAPPRHGRPRGCATRRCRMSRAPRAPRRHAPSRAGGCRRPDPRHRCGR